jgi:hypothetical protein
MAMSLKDHIIKMHGECEEKLKDTTAILHLFEELEEKIKKNHVSPKSSLLHIKTLFENEDRFFRIKKSLEREQEETMENVRKFAEMIKQSNTEGFMQSSDSDDDVDPYDPLYEDWPDKIIIEPPKEKVEENKEVVKPPKKRSRKTTKDSS